MYSIHIANHQRVLRVQRPRLVQLAESALASERVRAADISVALVDDARIHQINRDFLGHDYPTDVISFLLDEDDDDWRKPPLRRSANPSGPVAKRRSPRAARRSAQRPSPVAPAARLSAGRRSTPHPGNLEPQAASLKPAPRGAGKSIGGEIIISAETARAMAADYGWRPGHELSLYLVHGLLHLCGYDDLTPSEQRLMRRREVEVLAPWKIIPHYKE